ncbi:EscU/YscU/HrcU family type III secretion system export apparatus switch protein [Enterobacter sp. 22466]|uniref:EscU/YscU/HrcU family type III secretion system export apparatus switch protein n=1 Tax=Enterobacter sp. 22466 TaxID=3453924 RepID=UPI003F842FB1
MAEKSEKPTEKRRKDSAKKGQTFKSKDITTTVVLVCGVVYLGHALSFTHFMAFYRQILRYPDAMPVKDYLKAVLSLFLSIVLPFIGLCFIAGAAITVLQTKFTIATEALKLNFKALNPVEGVKKIFSLRTVKEFVKALCYLVVFVCCFYIFVHQDLQEVLSVSQGNIIQLAFIWGGLIVKVAFLFISLAVMVLIPDALAEFFIYFKDLKMDKHEVKQERKESDGNPEIKRARRTAHMEILSGDEQMAIRNSEVVLANPTHIAMALYFKPEVAMLPFVTLRVTNMKAKAAIAFAEKEGIPVVRYPPLTRRLYKKYALFSFISLNDDDLLEIMKVLIWLQEVEHAGRRDPIEQADHIESENVPLPPREDEGN